ncbi:MAG: insulinase family protein [Firmicutes bacterium]|nr:insulinase family protein [Bacillota bacterium]
MRRNGLTGEYLYGAELRNGLKCFVIPKKEYVEKQAAFVVKYGSADRLGGQEPPPDGVAHFMEHKMFEDPELNMYDAFMKNGADVNAYTNFTVTAYYFTCIDNFYENLRLLARLVREPFFTDENVEKEKGIISQEIDMYEDNAHWRLYMNLQNLLYGDSLVSADIAGSVDSIRKIDKDVLYRYYQGFYVPSNMALVCAGDVDGGEAEKICAECFGEGAQGGAGRSEYGHEARPYSELPAHASGERVPNLPDDSPVRRDYAEKALDVALPVFGLGFKDRDFDPASSLTDKIAAYKILADAAAGPSSPLYERMYNEGVIDGSFHADYAGGGYFGVSLFSGASREPERAKEMILGEIARLKNEGIDRNRFETVKRKHIGRLTAGFNAIDWVAGTQAELFTLGRDLFDLADSYENVTAEAVDERLRGHYLEENCALSMIVPKNRQS